MLSIYRRNFNMQESMPHIRMRSQIQPNGQVLNEAFIMVPIRLSVMLALLRLVLIGTFAALYLRGRRAPKFFMCRLSGEDCGQSPEARKTALSWITATQPFDLDSLPTSGTRH